MKPMVAQVFMHLSAHTALACLSLQKPFQLGVAKSLSVALKTEMSGVGGFARTIFFFVFFEITKCWKLKSDKKGMEICMDLLFTAWLAVGSRQR